MHQYEPIIDVMQEHARYVYFGMGPLDDAVMRQEAEERTELELLGDGGWVSELALSGDAIARLRELMLATFIAEYQRLHSERNAIWTNLNQEVGSGAPYDTPTRPIGEVW